MSKLSHSHPDHGILYHCPRCGSPVYEDEINIEAFELCGDIVCEGCAGKIFEENDE